MVLSAVVLRFTDTLLPNGVYTPLWLEKRDISHGVGLVVLCLAWHLHTAAAGSGEGVCGVVVGVGKGGDR